jgi:hypothetical protein
LGKKLSSKTGEWKYKNRNVHLDDGTVINLEDTKSIRERFPTATRLNKQWGWPKLRFLTFFDASSGAFIDGEIGSFCGNEQAETSLLRKMLSRIESHSAVFVRGYFSRIQVFRGDSLIFSLVRTRVLFATLKIDFDSPNFKVWLTSKG